MSDHTPGPWTYGVRKDGSIWLSLGNHLDLEAAHYQGDLVGTGADARLICAAPELLEALKLWDTGCRVQDGPYKGCHCYGCQTRRAIAKAEGR